MHVNSTTIRNYEDKNKVFPEANSQGWGSYGWKILGAIGTQASGVGGFTANKIKDVGYYTIASLAARTIKLIAQLPDNMTIETALDKWTQNRLKNLDKNNILPEFSKNLAIFICSLKKNMLPKDSFSIENYVQFTIHRALAKLACYAEPSEEGEDWQLISNILRNIFNILDAPLQDLSLDLQEYSKLQKQIKDGFISPQYISDKIESLESELGLETKPNKIELELKKYQEWERLWCVDTQNGTDREETQTTWIIKFMRASLLEKLTPPCKEILKAAGFDKANGKIERYFLEKNIISRKLAEYLLDFYVELQPISTLTREQKKLLAQESRHEIFNEGIEGLFHGAFTRYMAFMAKKKIPKVPFGADPLWLTTFFKSLGSPKDSFMQNFIALIAKYISPRLVEIIEHLALAGGEGSDIFERALLNGMRIFREEIKGKESAFSKTIKYYDQNGLKAEAYEAFRLYCLEAKNIEPAFFVEEEITLASELSSEDIKKILQQIDKEKRFHFLNLFNHDEQTVEEFFTLASGRHARAFQKKNLQIFAPLSLQILKATGLDNDAIIGFGQNSPFKFLGLDFQSILNDFIPILLLQAYRAVDANEAMEGTQVLNAAVNKFTEHLRNSMEPSEQKIGKLQQLLRIFAPKMSLESVNLWAKTIFRTSQGWFEVLNDTIITLKTSWTKKEQKHLQQLDPTHKLPGICNTLANKVVEGSKKAIVNKLADPLVIQLYEVVDDSPEIKKFANSCLSHLLERVIARLALSCKETRPNSLLINATKTFVTVLKDSILQINLDEVIAKLKEHDAFKEKLAKMPAKEIDKSEKKHFKQLHQELVNQFSLITAPLLATIGLHQASDLQLVILPLGNAKIQELVWKTLNQQLPEIWIELCRGLQVKSLLTDEKQKSAQRLAGYIEAKRDSSVIANRLMPICFGWMGRKENRFTLAHTMKDLLDAMEIEGLQRFWVEELLAQLADEDSSKKDPLIQSIWTFLENIVSPRLFAILEHVAVQNPKEGNFFQQVVVNSVNLVKEALEGKDFELKQTISEYDEWGLIAEAYDWRNRYLKEIKGVKAKDCARESSKLTEEDVLAILEMGFIDSSEKNPQKVKALLKAIKKYLLPKEDQFLTDSVILANFFSSFDSVGIKDCKESHKELAIKYDQAKTSYADWQLIVQACKFRDEVFALQSLAEIKSEDTAAMIKGLSEERLYELKNKAAAASLDWKQIVNAIRRVVVDIDSSGLEDDALIKEFFSTYGLLKAEQKSERAYKIGIESLLLYDLRDQYLMSKGAASLSECKKMAENLTEEDLEQILIDNGLEEDLPIIEAGISRFFLENSRSKSSKLLQYLKLPGNVTAREMQKFTLKNGFGPVGDKVLKLTGLTNDQAFSLPGATGKKDAYCSLQFVREVVIPQTIMNLYRDMSDFSGRNKANIEHLNAYFKDDKEIAKDLISFFADQITVKTKKYLQEHSEVVAQVAHEYLPASVNMLKGTVKGIISADRGTPFTQMAANEMTLYMEGLIKANLTHLLVELGKLKPFEEEPEISGIIANAVRMANSVVAYIKPAPVPVKESSPQVLENVLRHLGNIFSKNRELLADKINIFRAKEFLWEAKMQEKNYSKKWLQEKRTAYLRKIFTPITEDLIALSGLTCKNLYVPSGMDATIWKAITKNVIPDLIGQFYLDMSELERFKGEDEEKLTHLGLTHGAGIARGMAHFAVNLTQSLVALDSKGFVEAFLPKTIQSLQKAPLEVAQRAGNALKAKEKPLQDALSQNLEETARSPEVNQVLKATAETIARPLILKGLVSAANNLNIIQEASSNILMELASSALRTVAEHFERVHTASVVHQVDNAYELTHSELLEVVTSDSKVLDYVSLLEIRGNIQKSILQSDNKLKGWFLTEEKKEELQKELDLANKQLEVAKSNIEQYVEQNWTDKGAALKGCLKAERRYRIAESQLTSAKKSWSQKALNQIYGESKENVSGAVARALHEKEEAYKQLQEFRKKLFAARRDCQKDQLEIDTSAFSQREESKNLFQNYQQRKKEAEGVLDEAKIEAGKALQRAEKAYRDYCDEYNRERLKNDQELFLDAIPGYSDLKIAFDKAQKDFNESDSLQNADLLESIQERYNDCIDEYKSKLLEKLELLDLTGKPEYIALVKQLETAEKTFGEAKTSKAKEEAEKDLVKVRSKFEKYRLNYYFKPYASKLLKFVDIEQFRNVCLSDKLPLSVGDTIVDQAIVKLPLVINNIYMNLTKPETLLGFMDTFLENLERSENTVKKAIKGKVDKSAYSEAKVESEDATAIKKAAGKMVIEAMKMMPTGFETFLFNIPGLEGATKGTLENAIGALVVDYITSQSVVGLGDSSLKSAVRSLLSTNEIKIWDEVIDDFVPGVNPFPLTKEAFEEKKAQKPTLAKLQARVKQKMAKRSEAPIRAIITSYENSIKSVLASYYDPVGQKASDFFATIIRSLYSDENEANKFIQNCSEFFQKIYGLIGMIAEILAVPFTIFSIIFWRIIRQFLASKSQQAVDSFSRINPERALFQVTNIVMNKFGDILSWHFKSLEEERQRQEKEDRLRADALAGKEEDDEFLSFSEEELISV